MTGGAGGVVGILLAAGAGRRMGAPKATVRVDGRPLVLLGVDALVDGGCDPVVVVTGAAGAAPPDLPGGVTAVHNDRWPEGMAGSVRTGLDRAGTTSAAAALVLPVDVPGVGAPVVRRLRQAHADAGGGPDVVLVATYGGRPRNPVLLGRAHWAAVRSSLAGDEGARGWLRDHDHLVTHVECGDVGDPHDLDTPADLAAWRGSRGGDNHVPTP